MLDETIRVVMLSRDQGEASIQIQLMDGIALVQARRVSIQEILYFSIETPDLGGREVHIEADDPVVAAVLAWALKPWLRPGRWRINGKKITMGG